MTPASGLSTDVLEVRDDYVTVCSAMHAIRMSSA
jgi:hypothetical protein